MYVYILETSQSWEKEKPNVEKATQNWKWYVYGLVHVTCKFNYDFFYVY